MINRVRSVFYSSFNNAANHRGNEDEDVFGSESMANTLQQGKYPYQRPCFLQLFSRDEIQATSDHSLRPIIIPRDNGILSWETGYAETINAGKSLENEDQASFHRGVLRTTDINLDFEEDWNIPYTYFGLFDGHAGSGCAIIAVNELHEVLHKRLLSVLQHIIPREASKEKQFSIIKLRNITTESLIIGALESAFEDMDRQIGFETKRYPGLGGCTALVSLFILGKLYVANAGDSRAILCRGASPMIAMSMDFTPLSERQRLQQLAYAKPHLLGTEYSYLQYTRRPLIKDLGQKMLCREPHMTGWHYRKVSPEDLKFPLVYGEGKRSRLLATIGVTR